MFKVVRYGVQGWRRRGGEMIPFYGRQFRERAEALAHAEACGRCIDGATVYRIEGEPVQGIWREPAIIATFGETPQKSPPG